MKNQPTEEEQLKRGIYIERMMNHKRLNTIDKIREGLEQEEQEIYQRLTELDEMSKNLAVQKQPS